VLLRHGLELANRLGKTDLETRARTELALWLPRIIPPPRLLPHESWVTGSALHPGGTLAATASQDKTVQLWDTATGQRHGDPLRHPHAVWALAFSPDGKYLLTNSGPRFLSPSEVRVWDLATGQPVGPVIPAQARTDSLLFNRTGSLLLLRNDHQIQIRS